VIDQMELIASQILGAGRVRRAAEKGRELAHGAEVVGLRLVRKLAHPHVLDHALAQRADGRCRD